MPSSAPSAAAPSAAAPSSSSVSRRLSLGLLGLLTLIAGCLVVERRTLLIVIPADSKRITFYYLFEGLSQLEANGSKLEQVQTDLAAIESNSLSFFFPLVQLDHPILEQFQFEKLRYFVDKSRKRQLCASRRVEIPDRDLFAAQLNKMIADVHRGVSLPDFLKIMSDGQASYRQMDKMEFVETCRAFGVGAQSNATFALGDMLDKYDDASFEQVHRAIQNDFAFIRFEPGRLRIVFPATADCARDIVANADKDRWIKHIESLVKPFAFEARDDGLHLMFGNPGEPIQLQYVDDRKISPQAEQDVFVHVGKPGPALLNGKPATATDLITRVLNDPRGSEAEDAAAAQEAKKREQAEKMQAELRILTEAARQVEAAKRAFDIVKTKSEGGRNFFRVQFRSPNAAELTTDQLSELATTVSSEKNYVVWFYLPTMDTGKPPWAASTRRPRKDVETRILNAQQRR